MRLCLLCCALALLSTCTRDAEMREHAAQMFANIVITAQAQRHPNAPPVQQSSQAIETAARAGLSVLDYEIEE